MVVGVECGFEFPTNPTIREENIHLCSLMPLSIFCGCKLCLKLLEADGVAS